MESSRASRLVAGTSRDITVDSAAELAILEREGVLLPRRLQTLTFGVQPEVGRWFTVLGSGRGVESRGSPCSEALLSWRTLEPTDW